METDRLDICQGCGNIVPRKTLALMRRKFAIPQGMNLFTYSEYNTSGWTPTVPVHATYKGLGVHPDIRWCKVNSSGHATPQGITIFQSPYSEDVGCIVYSAAVTHAADFYYCFSAFVGQYEEGTYASPIQFHLGTYAGATFSSVHSQYVSGSQRIWHCNTSKTSSGSISWAIQCTKDSAEDIYWWFEHAQLETSTTTPFTGPGPFIKTIGSATTRSVDTHKTEVAKVCNSCRERLVEEWELKGIPKEDADPAIPFFGGLNG